MILQFGFSHYRRRRTSEVNLAYLQSFRSLVSNNLKTASNSLKLGSGLLSLTWINECFRMIPVINKAFAKLMVEIDYPLGRWESGSVDAYLDYTIALLEVLNAISSSIGHVSRARVSLAHALSLMESSPALAIQRFAEINVNSAIQHKQQGLLKEFTRSALNRNEEEWIFHEAMVVLKTTVLWVCGVVLSGLRSEIEPVVEIAGNKVSIDSSLMALDCIFRKKLIEQRGIVKEIDGVNECIRLITSGGIGDSDVGMELKRRLEVVGIEIMGLKVEEECIFGSVMTTRNEVLETIRWYNN